MIELSCGGDLVELGVRTAEGWNITRFLDHLEGCEECSREQDRLLNELNRIIGREK